jgi:pyruvate kinase
VGRALETLSACAVFVPTHTGATVRMLSRFKPSVWIVAACTGKEMTRRWLFSYGVYPVEIERAPGDWSVYASDWLKRSFPSASHAILISGPSSHDTCIDFRIEFLKL